MPVSVGPGWTTLTLIWCARAPPRGDALLTAHEFVVLPSVVSTHSWNLIFDPVRSGVLFHTIEQGVSVSILASIRPSRPEAETELAGFVN